MIRLTSVHKRYRARTALRPFSLTVDAGQVVALVGPNGAGKSTAIKIATGLVRPDGGEAWINGFEVAQEPESARALVGYVPQRLAFPDYVTCDDLCRLVAALRGVPHTEAIAELHAAGLGGRLTSRVREMSGGQRQRLSLALALVGSPRALVLDEPSISLDAEGAEAVCRAIAGARERGAAVLFASHHLHEVAALADRLVLLREGTAIADAPAAPLREAAALERFYRAALQRESADAA